jgi:hypothetical protein
MALGGGKLRQTANALARQLSLGKSELLIDEQKGVDSLRGRANNELDGVEVFRFDLRATSDDAGYVR